MSTSNAKVEDRHFELAKQWMWQGFTSLCAQHIANWEAERIAQFVRDFAKLNPKEALFLGQWASENGMLPPRAAEGEQ